MLRNRVVTSLILAPSIISAVYFLDPIGFAVLWGITILVASWEWSHLSGLSSPLSRLGFVGILLGAQLTGSIWVPYTLDWLFWPVVAWWFLFALALRVAADRLLQVHYPIPVKLLAGFLVLLSAWVLMVWLRIHFGSEQVIYLLVMIWIADITAYFVGKRWGQTKLLAQISPGKTVEGVYGALLATGLLAVGVGFWVGLEPIQIADFAFLSLITVAVSICGDLFESFVKRLRGVKDSSGILPGHGGVLDRNDSLIAAVSVFYAGSFLLGIFLNVGSVNQESVTLHPDSPDAMEMQIEEDEMSGDETTEGAENGEHDHDHSEAGEKPHTHEGKPQP